MFTRGRRLFHFSLPKMGRLLKGGVYKRVAFKRGNTVCWDEPF